MRRCSQCLEDIPQGVHAKKCREPGCHELLCGACYYQFHFCPEHLDNAVTAPENISATGQTTQVHARNVPEVSSEPPVPLPCRNGLLNFQAWLQFYTTLTDPADLVERAFKIHQSDVFNGEFARSVITFRKGSRIELFWVCPAAAGMIDPVIGTGNDPVPGKIFEKIGRTATSDQVCAGIFSPTGWAESSAGNIPEAHVMKGRMSIMLIDAAEVKLRDTDRIATCMKPLFVPWSITVAEQRVRNVIEDLFGRYIRVSDRTVMDHAEVPRDLVVYTARRMADEKRCRIVRNGKGIDLIRTDV